MKVCMHYRIGDEPCSTCKYNTLSAHAKALEAALDLANMFLANRAYTQHHMREQWASNPAGAPLLESLARIYSAPETKGDGT